MRLYAFSNGQLAQARAALDDTSYGPLPVGASLVLEFDDTTNATLLASLANNWASYTFTGGALRLNGAPVTVNPPGDQYNALAAARTGYPALPAWAQTGTADDAVTFINGQVFNGQSVAQATAFINSTIPNVSGANVAALVTSTNAALAGVRTVFITAATAIINMRGLFVLTAKLLIYIRDLVIRFRTL